MNNRSNFALKHKLLNWEAMNYRYQNKMDYNDGRYHLFSLKDPWSCITFIICGSFNRPCARSLYTHLKQENRKFDRNDSFMLGLVGLYSASGIYHGLDINEKVNKSCSGHYGPYNDIYADSRCTYSPICLCVLKNKTVGTVCYYLDNSSDRYFQAIFL